MEKLLEQFQNPNVAQGLDSSMTRSFSLMYVQIGIGRLPKEKQGDLIPSVIKDISSLQPKHSATLFSILLKLLPNWKEPERGSTEADNLGTTYGFDTRPQDAQFLAEKFTHLFLLDLSELNDRENTPPFRCPGLNFDQFEFLTQNTKEKFTGSTLLEAKRNVLRFLNAGGFTDANLYFPLLIASHDINSVIIQAAETPFRKLKVNLENAARVDYLYQLVLGSPAQNILPAKVVVQAHAIQLLAKSKLAANLKPFDIVKKAMESEYFKSVHAGFAFIRWMAKQSSDETLATIAKDLVTSIGEYITRTGWPRLPTNDQKKLSVRSLAYEAIGSVISRQPSMITDLGFITFLLDSLEKDIPDMRPSIQEALSEILPAVDQLTDEAKTNLQQLLLKYLLDPQSDDSCKYVAVKFAVRAYPFSDPTSRLICLLGLKRENRSDILEEAKRGLHPHWFKTVNTTAIRRSDDPSYSVEFPSFSDLITLVQDTSAKLISVTPSPQMNGFPFSVYDAILSFLQQVLVMEAVAGKKTALIIDEDWATRIDTAIDLDESVRDIFIKHLADAVSSNQFQQIIDFVKLAFDGLELAHSEIEQGGQVWLRMLSLSPSVIVAAQVECLDRLEPVLYATREKLREIASTGIGIISTHPDNSAEKVSALVSKLVSFVSTDTNHATFKHTDKLHGYILGAGAILARLHVRQRTDAIDYKNQLNVFLTATTKVLKVSKNLQLIDACIGALSQLAIFGALSSETTELFTTLKESFESLAIKKDNEKAVLALGFLSLCDPAFTTAEGQSYYIDKLFQLTNSKHTEFMFSSGEALSIIGAGWDSKVLKRNLDIQDISTSALPRYGESNDELLGGLVDKVLTAAKSPKPSLRKFSCLWLLSLLQYCGHLSATKSRLEYIHIAFMRFLPEHDELIQESASRGLSMVYEMGDSSLKDSLVKSLVSSFTADTKHSVNSGAVSEDTQLFEPGVLNTGDGSVSTYKDILNLASDLGDPSLIYRFMSLAAHSSLWSSRKGAAFGLGSILSKANLDEMFENNQRMSKTLIPKLYRYKFDSNPSVQQAMQGIWDALVKDKTAAMNDNFNEILDELLKGMGEKEWRVRQASAAALSDLLQGKPIDLYQDKLEKIWQMSFRTVDDIKESVRTAGMQLTRGLANTLIRHVDTDSGASPKRAAQILENLVPFLIGNSGLQSDAEEIQSFALDTIIKLCKKGGKSLKPYIPGLVEELLVLMSTLEPQAMNYLALNADKYGLTHSAIDASRLASIRGSPIMEAVEQMIDQVNDDETMKALVPRLSTAIRKSVGLPSKVGASRVLVALTIRHLHTTEPYADTLLAASNSQLSDRNDTISQSYATASGYLSRIASDNAILKYASLLQNQYFTAESTRPRQISGFAINALSKHASDKFNKLASAFLPFIYIAKHDPEKSVQELFNTAWTDNTGGSGAIRLYLKEIIELSSTHLSSQQWVVRQVSAQAVANASNLIADQATSTGAGSSLLSSDDLDKLFDILFKACTGRSWSGKELVLGAIVSLAANPKSLAYVQNHPDLIERLNKLVVVEAKRKNKEYQVKAIGCFGEYLAAFPQAYLYDILFELADPYLTVDGGDESDSDSDVEMTGSDNAKATGSNNATAGLSKAALAKEEARNEVLAGVVKSYGKPDPAANAGRKESSVIWKITSYLAIALAPETAAKTALTWRTKIAVTGHLISLAKLHTTTPQPEPEPEPAAAHGDIPWHALNQVWTAVVATCASDQNHEKVRVESVRAGGALLALLRTDKAAHETQIAALLEQLKALQKHEKSPVVNTELANVLSIS